MLTGEGKQERVVNYRQFARAKVNLSLQVFGRLSSGLHRISSIVCPLELADDVEVSIAPGSDKIVCVVEFCGEAQAQVREICAENRHFQGLVAGLGTEDNLCVRAARQFLAQFLPAVELALEIRVKKRIPLQAGLGGGSADAAALLRILSAYAQTWHGKRIPEQEMLLFAASIGSDVAAQYLDRPCAVEGTGEIVRPLQITPENTALLAKLGVVVLKPPVGSDTALAYRALARPKEDSSLAETRQWQSSLGRILEQNIASMQRKSESLGLTSATATGRCTAPICTEFAVGAGKGSPVAVTAAAQLTAEFSNDFEEVVCREIPPIAKCFAHLRAKQRAEDLNSGSGILRVLLAGSGSSVLAFTESFVVAERVVAELKSELPVGYFVVPTRLSLVQA